LCPLRYRNFIENQIYAQYPEAQITPIHDYAELKPNRYYMGSEIVLSKEFFLPIRTFVSFVVDPLASITGAVSSLKGDSEVWIQIVARPVNNAWQEAGKKYIENLKTKSISDTTSEQNQNRDANISIADIERKSNKVGFQFAIRIVSSSSDKVVCEQILEDVEASFKQFQTAQQNSLVKKKVKKTGFVIRFRDNLIQSIFGKRPADKLNVIQKFHKRFLDERETNILNVEELASIYHLPHESVKTPNIAWAKSRKLEYPLNIPTINPNLPPQENPRIFAVTDYRNIHIPFGIKKLDRRRHMYLLGK